ncbi:MAG: 4Fe-4S dicluster domain-containing protein [Candidatus Brocadiia bacterium]|nr:MAG: 4Fe-4S dicluster domain-containing protein [Candidatus Brocadiia bacterium]
MRWPKLRELKEAVTAVLSPRFTTRFPNEPCNVPESYRGKPEFDLNKCIGCGACVNVCPTEALTMTDELATEHPVRKITLRYDTCIFCGNCEANCTTEKGITLSNKWDLAGLDRTAMKETHEFELQVCEKCGELVGAKKHLVWIYEKLGPLSYTNPSLIIAKYGQLAAASPSVPKSGHVEQPEIQAGDYMRTLCPKCKCKLNIQL